MGDAAAFATALGSVVLVDQALKAALLASAPQAEARDRAVGIRPTRSRHTIATALGFPGAALPVLWVGILVVVLLVGSHAEVFRSAPAWAGVGVALGGAASNVIDRLARGAVIDFLRVGPWPAFNLADAAIVIGVLVAVVTG